MKPAMGAQAATCAAFHSPVSSGEMRPRGSTAVASAMTSPAPPAARAPRCTRCQSVGTPFSAEYWHIGETMIRLRNVTLRSVSGCKSAATANPAARQSGRTGRGPPAPTPFLSLHSPAPIE